MSRVQVITQGEHFASGDQDLLISTLLGSCVACCLFDIDAGVGGMNHILLAQDGHSRDPGANLLGVNAMEVLINDMVKLGALRHQLRAKLFGGAQMVTGLSEIGPANSAFALAFLEKEMIPCLSHSTGGNLARHIVFSPATGKVRMRMRKRTVLEAEAPTVSSNGNGLELL